MTLAAIVLLTGCARREPRFVIGVSQCSQDIWRDKLNSELRMGAYAHDDIELRFASADDSDELQISQIEQFVSEGIDLLIVAPNQVSTVTPVIDRVFDSGIPVIVFDRKTNTEKFTAYIGADNREMGRMMGEFIATQLGGRGRVVEIMGLKGSSPAIERHEGFAEALSRYPGLELVASLQGDWTEQSGYEAIQKYEGELGNIDYVFGQNDRMAMGARRAMLREKGRVKSEEFAAATDSALETMAAANSSLFTLNSSLKFCGIDALPGKGGGIELVRDSLLMASCIYPTHGDEVLQLALDILEGRPYAKDNRLLTALVTPDNASVIQMQSAETQRQSTYLDRLHEQSDQYLKRLNSQRTITLLALGVIVLLLLVILLLYQFEQGKISLRHQREVSNLWNLENEPQTAITKEEESDDAQGPKPTDAPAPSADSQPTGQEEQPAKSEVQSAGLSDTAFIIRFKDVVEKRLAESELSVEDLAADMHLSRVQLYRKVKSVTGSSPVELLRTARLNRGYQMLLTTDKSVSEVAYAVGFTAPSYFTKCFKDEFGKSPTDMKQ